LTLSDIPNEVDSDCLSRRLFTSTSKKESRHMTNLIQAQLCTMTEEKL